MWLLGLVVGMLVGGAVFGFAGAALGGGVGLLAGAWGGRQRGGLDGAAMSGETEFRPERERLRALEAQVQWLHRETKALRHEIAVLRGDPAATGPAIVGKVGPDEARADTPAPPADSAVVSEPLRPVPEAAEAFVEPPPAPPEDRSPTAAPAGPSLWSRLSAGNPLAKIGVVLLFFGLASAFRLAAEYGFLPPSLRLLVGAVAGVAMIAFGLRKAWSEPGAEAPPHRTFGLAIQGGGFGVLYLVVYFMLARYTMISSAPAFALFGALGVACVLLAAKQDGPALAVLGLGGAFLAPVMAGGHSPTPLPLFLYFALLNAFILGVDWFRAWRVLNIAGFLFTLAIGMGWAIGNYRPEHYAVTQGFLILFLLMYSATPVATALLRAPGEAAWREGMLVFGTPLVGGLLQTPLVEGFDKGLAWSAFIGALYYFGLWAIMYRRGSDAVRLLERSHLGIAVALLTITIPLAFDAQVTSAFWAAEGAAVLWFGTRTGRHLAQATGLLMQGLAGLAFVLGYPKFGQALPVLNDVMIGGLLLAGGGLVCARLLQRLETGPAGAPVLPSSFALVWALTWWFGAGFHEIHHWVGLRYQVPAWLIFVAASVLALEGLGVLWRWAAPRHVAWILVPALWLATGLALDRGDHPLVGLMLLALPLGFVIHYWLLARHERAAAEAQTFTVAARMARHLGAWWLAIFVVAFELAWLGWRLAPDVSLWTLLAVGVGPVLGLALADFGLRRGLWPWASAPEAYAGSGALPVQVAVALWLLGANFTHAGGGSGLPYLPFLNFLDLTQIAALAMLWRGVGAPSPALRRVAGILAFIWLTALAARIAHHWGGVPFSASALFDSRLCQAMVTLLWTVVAIAAMIHASRSGRREHWIGGMALLAVVGGKLLLVDAAGAGTLAWTGTLLGVALLVLAAGYFAPLPPKAVATGTEPG